LGVLRGIQGRLISLTVGRRPLIVSLVAMAALCAYRALDLWVTGFIVSDEFGYILTAIQGSLTNATVGDRYFFSGLNLLLFRLLGITNVDGFIILLPFYIFFWDAFMLTSFYFILRTLEFDDRIVAFSLFSCFFLVSFVLLSVGFLTEPVGLALAMAGILCLVKFAKNDGRLRYFVLCPLLGALAFGAARYTREPYAIFLVGGIVVVAVVVMKFLRSPSPQYPRGTKIGLAILAVVLFAGPGLYLINNPVSLNNAGVGSDIGSLAQTISQPITSVNTTTTMTNTRTLTRTTTGVSVMTENGTTTTSTTTGTVTVTSVETTVNQGTLLILNNQIVNTIGIFFAGMVLGWGPILFVIGAAGFFILLRRAFRRRDSASVVAFLIVLLALGSYLFVSFIFSPDPTYLSFQHFSTIIRFSDTAIPAYLLGAPFVFAALARRGRSLTFLAILLVAFLVVAIPVYQVFAASNLGLGGNPFALSYRTPGVEIRDFVYANPSGAPFYIMAPPDAFWTWTPGSGHLASVHFFLYLNESQFVKQHWSTFYLYGGGTSSLTQAVPYLGQAIEALPTNSSANSQPFQVTGRQVIFDDQGGLLMKIQVSWAAGPAA
jgi:hypothetical protein